MRRAVRDYKYEVNEGRMTEECNQYLQQLQKDWERHRVKMGVEQLRREVSGYLHSIRVYSLDIHHFRHRSANENATGMIAALPHPSTKYRSTRNNPP